MTKLKKDLIKENEMLMERLTRLENMLVNKEKKQDKEESQDGIIPMTKIIKVVSLYHGILNLKTSDNSAGTIFKFNFFGDEKPIFYSDLVKCISTQQRFFNDGFCMVLDDEVVKAHYLESVYKNLLTKEQIENFLNFSESEMTSAWNKIPTQQKITIVESVARKINSDSIIDRNKVDLISKISNENIIEIAEKIK